MSTRPQHPPSPAWHESYRAALLELDANKVPGRISIAMDTLMQHLGGANLSDQRLERDRILQAIRMLELLKRVSGQVHSDHAANTSAHGTQLLSRASGSASAPFRD